MARTRLLGCFDYRTLFDFRNAGRNAHNHAGLKENACADNLFEEVAQQSFRNVEIGNNAVAKRTYRNDIARSPSEHTARFLADSINLARYFFNRNNGGFTQHDTLVFYIYQYAGGTEIDTDIVEFKHTHYF